MLSLFARAKNTVKGEEVIQDGTGHDYGLIDEFLERGSQYFQHL